MRDLRYDQFIQSKEGKQHTWTQKRGNLLVGDGQSFIPFILHTHTFTHILCLHIIKYEGKQKAKKEKRMREDREDKNSVRETYQDC